LDLLRDSPYGGKCGAEAFGHSIHLLQKGVWQSLEERVRRCGVQHPTANDNAPQKISLSEHFECIM